MNKTFKRYVSLLGIIFFSTCMVLPVKANAAKKDTITWYTTDWAPFYITRGKQKNKGINDRLIRYIHEHLPNYNMEFKNMNATLLEQAFENGDNVCQLDLFKTPHREKLAYFTKTPSIIDASLRVFIRAADEQRLNLQPPVDINALLNNSKLKGTFVSSRSYSTMIDNAIKTSNNDRVKTNESTKRVIKNFFRGRTDYVVEYSAVMSYLKSLDKYKGNIYSFPIKDTPPYVLGYVGCSKTLWGKTVVDSIDAVLKSYRHDETYKEELLRWHDDRVRQVILENFSNF